MAYNKQVPMPPNQNPKRNKFNTTPVDELDYVLRFFATSPYARPYIGDGEVDTYCNNLQNHDFTKEQFPERFIPIERIGLILDKLHKDGYLSKELFNGVAIDEHGDSVSIMKYKISWDGEDFIKNKGGYNGKGKSVTGNENMKEKGDKYLNALYFKSQNDFAKGYDEKILSKYLLLTKKDIHNIITYLEFLHLIDTKSGFGNDISLTPKGIEHVERIRENKVFKTIKFKGARHLPSQVDANEFNFSYCVINENGILEDKVIKVSISGDVSAVWGFQVWTGKRINDEDKLIKILLHFAKEHVFEKLKNGVLNKAEVLNLLSSNQPSERPFNPDDLIELKDAEYEIEIGKKIKTKMNPPNKIELSTRRNILDGFIVTRISWYGNLEQAKFLGRLFDLSALPSTDIRYKTAEEDIWKHTVMNNDWTDEWVFTDGRFNILHLQDNLFLEFLCLTIHPTVRDDKDQVVTLLEIYNNNLAKNGYELIQDGDIAGRPKYSAREIKPVMVTVPSPKIETKLALVIGCSEYSHAGTLKNPLNDANSIEIKLQSLGYDVIKTMNPNQKDLKLRIDEFGDKLKRYDVGLFYFAGHGVQVKGLNYLIPVDANLKSERMVEYDCVEAGRVLGHMEESNSKINIVILDACRDNPFERSWGRGISLRGLTTMSAPSGSLIAYSTAPGKTASDGDESNGLYTQVLLEHIGTKQLGIMTMFQKVRNDVINKSKKEQTPWEATSLTSDYFFNP